MDVGILGPLTVLIDGREIALGPAKPRAVLAMLAVRRDQVVPIASLVSGLWDGHPPATAPKIIQGYISQLRKALGGDGILQTHAGGYRLHLTPDQLDASRFEGLLHQGRAALATGSPAAAGAVLREALGLWRGPPLAEFAAHDFAVDTIDRLAQLRLLAVECRLEADLALGEHAAVVPELRALIRENPLRESLPALLMVALYRSGRQADALAVYRDARAELIEQLGIEPGDALRRVELGILAHDPALDPPPSVALPARPAQSTAAPQAPVRRTPSTQSRPPRPAASPPPTSRRPSGRPHRGRRSLVLAAVVTMMAACVVAFVHPSAPPSAAAGTVDEIGFVDASTGTVTEQIPVDQPTAVAADGAAVWAVEPAAQAVTRIDAASGARRQTVGVGADPSGVAVGDGSVWVTNHGAGTVSRISPETDTVAATIAVGAGPAAVALGDGSVWVANGDDRTLTRIDEASGRVVATIDTDAVGRGLAVGDGAVWVTDEATGRVVVVDPATNSVSATVPVGNGPTGIADGNGAVWVVNALDDTVSRVNPATQSVDATIAVPGDPSSIAIGVGAVWVGTDADQKIVRIDPGRALVTDSTALGGRPEALAVTGRGVWVASQAAGTAHRGGRIVVIGGIDSIDPSVSALNPGAMGLAYDALTGLRHVGGSAGTEIVPDLAWSLPQPTAGGTGYTFRLRPQISYSDGRPLLAADFRRGLERLLRLNGSLAQLFSHVVGAAACGSGLTCDLRAGVQVEGTSTVTFHLATPDPRFLEEVSYLIPVPDGTPAQDSGSVPVPGTGPYAIGSYVPNRLLVFDRNPYFRVWSTRARPDGYPDEIVYRADTDNDDAVRQVAAGQADLVQLVGGATALAGFAAQHPAQVHVVDQQATVLAFLNTRTPPFDDVRVRRAVNDAVDRAHVAELDGAGRARPTCQVVPPTSTGYRPYCPYTVDPDDSGQWRGPDLSTAQALVDASGTKGQPVVLWTFADFADEADYLADVLSGLGYPTTVHEIADATEYFETVPDRVDPQAGLWGWFDLPLAVDGLSLLQCDFQPNPARFCDSAVDAQIHQLAAVEPVDPDGARDLAAQIDREITDEAPWVALFTPQTVDVTSARIGNYQAERGRLLVDQLWVQPSG